MTEVLCPYCKEPSEKVRGDAIYPNREDLHSRLFYRCEPCDAYVGTHSNSGKPLGRLANAELRTWKIRAHTSFDSFWRLAGMKRGAAYGWLANILEISKKSCHIGHFDVDQCKRVIEVCELAKKEKHGNK